MPTSSWHRRTRRVRSCAGRFGGSYAQRDVLDLTLSEAALHGNDRNLARALAAERLTAKNDIPLATLFTRRSGLKAAE